MHRKLERSGFTLVELLLVIAIIAILASLGVGVMSQAQNDAAEAATRSRATIIQKILEIELEDYEVRRSPVPLSTLSTMVASSGLEPNRTLLHVKNLKRMLVADLIRAEMPDGSVVGGRNIGDFPSLALNRYFTNQLGINPALTGAINRPASVSEWETWARKYIDAVPTEMNWPPIKDTNGRDGIPEDAAFRSELLFETLQRIDVDGVPATESLGQSAIGDTNGNGFLEILDGWGEPMFLQWQQEFVIGDPEEGIYSSALGPNGETMCGLSCEHFFPDSGISVDDYVAPVLPSQIRPFLTSEKLFEIDGYPTDAFVRSFN